MNLKPLGDRVIVKAVDEEEVTSSGIVPLEVAENDEVIYSKYGGTEVKVDGDDLLILAEHDILARVAASKPAARAKK